MNEHEYLKWKLDATIALLAIYSKEDTVKILNWFDNIKGSAERDLVGETCVNAFQIFHTNGKHWNLYNSLMSRLFVYAPYIIASEN